MALTDFLCLITENIIAIPVIDANIPQRQIQFILFCFYVITKERQAIEIIVLNYSINQKNNGVDLDCVIYNYYSLTLFILNSLQLTLLLNYSMVKKHFRAQLRTIIDRKFFFRLMKIYAQSTRFLQIVCYSLMIFFNSFSIFFASSC